MKNLILSVLFLSAAFYSNALFAATIESFQTGDWDIGTTWVGGSVPLASDEVIIKDNHVITKSGVGYTHNGNLLIEPNGELIMDCGNSSNGFTFDGGDFHVFGTLTGTFPDKDLTITGNSFFWGHPSAVIFISDDWIVEGNSINMIEGICVEVDDDFTIDGPNTSLCGAGSVSIGTNAGSNTFDYDNGATSDQVCLETGVYRGAGGGACGTLIENGTGNGGVIAVNDNEVTNVDVPITIDVIDRPVGTPDNDPEGDDIELISVGVGYSNDGLTKQGGTVSINNNGTPLNPNDDYVDYTPPLGYEGLDDFLYVVNDGNGSYDWALVVINIQAPLPIELYDFKVSNQECKTILNWVTASESDNDYFEIQRSSNGIDFEALGIVGGAGSSNSFHEYQFVDQLPLTGKNYYRIKQVDYSLDFSFTPTLTIQQPCNERQNRFGLTQAFPNPISSGVLTLIYDGEQPESKTVILSDIYGKVYSNQNMDLKSGRNYLKFPTDELESGTYIISIGRNTTKFLKMGLH